MPLTDHKITKFVKRIIDLADLPSENMSPADIKAWLDSSPEELRVKLNALIDDLGLETAATFIGAKDGITVTTVQAVLDKILQGFTNLEGVTNTKIADFESTTNTKVADIEVVANGANVKSDFALLQANNIIANAGDSNTEIVDARLREDGTIATNVGTHIREVTAQLAEIVTFVNPGMTQDAINTILATKNHVRFQTGIYNVDVTKRILPKSNQIIEFEDGAELKAIATNLTGYEILKIVNIDNLTIIGGIVTGERATHIGTTGEHGHGVWIQNTNNLVIKGMQVRDCWGDGFYHMSGNNTHLDRIQAINNRRNNITVVGANVLTIDSPIIKSANGTPPYCGIDIEPNYDTDSIKGIVINNPYFEDNLGNDIGIYLLPKSISEDTISVTINNPVSKCEVLRQAAMVNINYIRPNVKGKIDINGGFVDNARFLSVSEVSSNVAINIKNPTIKDWANSSLGAMTIRNSVVMDTNMKLGNITIDNPKFIINQYSGATLGIEVIDDRALVVGTEPIYVTNPTIIGAYAGNIKAVSSTYGAKYGNVFVTDSAQDRQFIDYSYTQQYAVNPNSQVNLLLPQDIKLDATVGNTEMLVEVVTMNSGGFSGEIALFTHNGTTWTMNEVIPLGKTSGSIPHQLILDGANKPTLKNKNGSTTYTFLVKTTLSGIYGVGKSSTFYKVNSSLLTRKAKSIGDGWSGATGNRPTNPIQYQQYFDTVLGKPIWYVGTVWKDATGTTV